MVSHIRVVIKGHLYIVSDDSGVSAIDAGESGASNVCVGGQSTRNGSLERDVALLASA